MSSNPFPSGVSIIICTFNGSRRLPKTVEHLNLQKVDSRIPWEVIVVDNASNDGSGDILDRLWHRTDAALSVVNEPIQGLSYARNRGVKVARFEYLSFIDDDNWVDEGWVQTVHDILHQKTEVGICGGHIEAECESKPTPWFMQFQDHYAVGRQSDTTGYIPDGRGYLWGAGLNLRKSAFCFVVSQGFQSFLSDRRGTKILAGGDTEICYAFRLAGWRLWYDERLKMKHFIPAQRLTWEHLCGMFQGFGAAHSILALYRDALSKERENKEFPGYLIMIRQLLVSLWRNRRYYGPPSRFQNIPEKIYYEFTFGQYKYLIATGPRRFSKFYRSIVELSKRLSSNQLERGCA